MNAKGSLMPKQAVVCIYNLDLVHAFGLLVANF